jgi:hypothetical protein
MVSSELKRMMKFSMPGSPFQKIWHVYDPVADVRHDCGLARLAHLTWLLQRHSLGDVLHEYAPFQLEPWLPRLGYQRLVHLFRFVGAELLAAKENHLEEVNLVLLIPLVSKG